MKIRFLRGIERSWKLVIYFIFCRRVCLVSLINVVQIVSNTSHYHRIGTVLDDVFDSSNIRIVSKMSHYLLFYLHYYYNLFRLK